MVQALQKNARWKGRRGPLVLVIMDGVGYGAYAEGDAVRAARMAHLDAIASASACTRLKAHGTAVGLPSDDDMGNSEVGHNAMGCGRVFAQGAKLVSASLKTGALFAGDTWKKLVANVVPSAANPGRFRGSLPTLHFIGLFSDGNVHSHIDHLKAMVQRAAEEGVPRVRVHILLDGRDVGETSALEYVRPFEEFLAGIRGRGCDARIASGGGRMYLTMDRYGADWRIVERGWHTHVLGDGRAFPSAEAAIETYRKEIPGIIDQDLREFVVTDSENQPIGAIHDGDSVVYCNFRGDRALEITEAFESPEGGFDKFDRIRLPKVEYAGMMEYDGDLHIPRRYLVSPPAIDRTLGEYLAATGIHTLAISETQKYGHVTYFFNGNRLGKFSETLETYVEIHSDVVPFEQRPWMKCAEITDAVIDAIAGGTYDFIRLNFPNGDMVGHTGVFNAVVCGMEGMDLQLGRLRKAVDAAGGVMILTADHGNSDDMYEHDKKTGTVLLKPDGTPRAKTSHSLNPVPGIVYDPDYRGDYDKALNSGLGIGSLAATCIGLLGYVPPADYDPALMNFSHE
ncbi:MAG: 2,3-bisphosphoglycerate-independent phosphoglycerate mutase [Spirochaetaceae bacterium]|jgi:2,3-bisphosphoglycerate-independent phosphoglycerate mutase|nr:2,3-bisphosphoglycerate-independent phosphoglycerate mutase [Spirochaetaceae bacterium]